MILKILSVLVILLLALLGFAAAKPKTIHLAGGPPFPTTQAKAPSFLGAALFAFRRVRILSLRS
jgi:hypothetical protein